MDKIIKEILSKYWKNFKKKPNFIGIDGKLRPKIKRKKIFKEIQCIRIYVSKKVPLEKFDLSPSYWERFKRIFRKNSHLHKQDLLPSFIENIPTDVIEIGPIKALGNKDRLRPLKAGISSMHYKSTACTTNGFFREKKTGKVCVASNNHCYLPWAQVLTRKGFKRWDRITGNEEFATLTKDGKLEYNKASKVFKLNYSGKLYEIRGSNFSFSVTSHQNIYAADAWKSLKKRKKFKLRDVQELISRLRSGKTTTMRLKRNCIWNCKDSKKWSLNKLKFLGWYLSEGSACINKIGQKIVSIRQREDRFYDEIYRVLKNETDKVWKCKSAIVANSGSLHSLLKELHLFGLHSNEKFIPTEVKNLPPTKLWILLETLMNGDGNWEYPAYFTTSEKLANDFIEIALKLGIPANLKKDRNSTNFKDNRILYRVILLHQTEPLIHEVREKEYLGPVYDVTVPNHILFIREKGPGIWSGNCYALTNKAKIGDPIIQPSPSDGGKWPEDEIGKLYKFIPIHFDNFSCPFRETLRKLKFQKKLFKNKVDIAFALVSVDWLPEATYIGPFKGKRLPKVGERVQKTGRTTEHTFGKVISLDWIGQVRYSRGIATFIDCILIEGTGFSAGGDSGSPVFDMNGNYLGALFAGSSSHTIVCKWNNIELESGMELIVKS